MTDLFAELRALKFTPWYRWHPQIAMRYLPVVDYINSKFRIQNSELKILEVGSGGLGIAPYLKMSMTGVDKEFEPPFHPMLKRVSGDATKLIFLNNSFDVVISMDMLEHLPKSLRQKAISEMVRVAQSAVVIGVPCGNVSALHDQWVQDSYKRQHGREFPFASEQLGFGLPEKEEIVQYLNTASRLVKKRIHIESKGNSNLRLRAFLMWGWMSKSMIITILFRKVFLLFIPLFRLIDQPPHYRQLFFVTVRR